MAGGILGEFPRPLDIYALPIQAEDASQRRQPSNTTLVGGHIVHSTQRLAANVGYTPYAATLGKPRHACAGQRQNRAIRLSLQVKNLVGR